MSDTPVERIHAAIQETCAANEIPGVVAKWAVIAYVLPPPNDNGDELEDYVHLFSDEHMASHDVIGLAGVLDAHARAQRTGLGHIGSDDDEGE